RAAQIAAVDADPTSVGIQLRTDSSGFVTVPLRADHTVGEGELRLSAATATGSVPLRIFASVRPLLATAVGQVGFGAAPGAFGAVTMQGAVTEGTSVSVSYDSRRTDDQSGWFQRGYDPIAEDRQPTFGDDSKSRVIAPSSKALSARVEHGMDWLAAGDVQTQGFGRDGELGAYRRALTGMSASLGTGLLTWHGFGSMTQQMHERRQLRGEGNTGPYLLDPDMRPGTEQVAIEVRARENAARVIARQELTRTTDYQIDYTTGAVLLRLPVPAADPYGNPVYVVATIERISGGPAHFVGGLRVDLDASQLLGGGAFDSLTFGVSGIRDGSGAGTLAALPGESPSTQLVNADFRLRVGGLALGAGLLRSQSPDSTGAAASAMGRWALFGDRITLDGQWMSVGQGLGSTDPRLASPMQEVSVGIAARLGDGNALRLHHQQTEFTQFGVSRSTSGLTAEETVLGRKLTQDIGLTRQNMGSGIASSTGDATAVTARLSTTLMPNVESWVDGSRAFATTDAALAVARPNHVGAGLTVKLPGGLKLEGSHRIMQSLGDSVAYGVTSAELRAEGILGGQLWSGFEESRAGLHDEVRAAHTALFGWNQRVPLGTAWQLTSLFERRIGLSRAQLTDPDRALPFAQMEPDRWSGAAGLAWLPGGDLARFALNGEMFNGSQTSGYRVQLNGDAALNAGLAILTLHDWSSRRDEARAGSLGETRQDRSLLGLALRPVTTERFNALAKVEWRRTTNPIGDALLSSSGRDARLIGTTDAVWAPVGGTELSARYAVRLSSSDIAGDSSQRVQLADHFAGARFEQHVIGPLRLRADGRMMLETRSGTTMWNAAPSAVLDIQGRFLLEGGYRFGLLRDPDFAAVGGAGGFVTAGLRFTENAFASPAAFWRDRILNDR
ncbi:MAG: hypothetical protein JWN53_1577, partial [Gemmatimonadetes bacterium]|nr:hypothetical protein [Gemmatimonadota bacterium]